MTKNVMMSCWQCEDNFSMGYTWFDQWKSVKLRDVSFSTDGDSQLWNYVSQDISQSDYSTANPIYFPT